MEKFELNKENLLAFMESVEGEKKSSSFTLFFPVVFCNVFNKSAEEIKSVMEELVKEGKLIRKKQGVGWEFGEVGYQLKRETAYTFKTTEALISEMLDRGLEIPYELAEELASREDASPYLLQLIDKDDYWLHGGPGDGWAPIHALHLLSAIGDIKTLPKLIELANKYNDFEHFGDWITEDLASVFAAFGTPAFEELKGAFQNKNLDMYVRDAAGRALIVIATKNPEIKREVVEVFKKVIMEEENKELVGFCICSLSDLKDKGVLPFIEQAFAEDRVDEGVINLNSVRRRYESEVQMNKIDMKEPLDYFKPDNLAHLWEVNYKKPLPPLLAPFRRHPISISPPQKKKKIGRNEPCPCGSGKKYKKCCLNKLDKI